MTKKISMGVLVNQGAASQAHLLASIIKTIGCNEHDIRATKRVYIYCF